MKKDFFAQKANSYEDDKNRVSNVQNIANTIKKELSFNKSMDIMDFGSGTGLLLEKIAPFVNKITAIDMSKSMNKKLNEKKDILDCELEILEIDLSTNRLNQKFDCIISSMTLHHIKDIKSLLKDFYTYLNTNASIAIADLDIEDGSFHIEDTGVFHFGFNREELENLVKEIGFKNVKIQDASIAYKPYGEYPVFLLTACK